MSDKPEPRPHYVDDAPYDPQDAPADGARPELDASAWRLTWRRFRRRRLALIAFLFIALLYAMLPFMGFIAPYGANERDAEHLYTAPQGIGLFHEGKFVGPYVYATHAQPNMETFEWEYVQDTTQPRPLEFFCKGASYNFLGVFDANLHLFCAPEGATVFLLGTDRLGRDVFSRILYGAQLSLTVGLIGIVISFVLGLFFGGMAGYFGGWIDSAVQRIIEILRSLPELPLWLALSAAVPATWSPVAVFFMISIILGLLDWPGLARAVRAKFLSLREEEFVRAAEMMGARPRRIIIRHMMPNFASHLAASAALSIPAMILGETALSYLGLGLRAPAVSWGVMLNDAQNLTAIEIYPWTAIVIVPIILVVLAFNFIGDGLRDALDPYSS